MTSRQYQDLSNRLTSIKQVANHQCDQFHVRDGVSLHVFVQKQEFDAGGNVINRDAQFDPVDNFSDDDEIIDDVEVSSCRFKIDLVARYPDEQDDLVLHWGMSRDKVGNWGAPEQSMQPISTQLMKDGLAAQTIFQREAGNNSIRTVSFSVEWSQEEKPFKSISFVLMEKAKNIWHSIDGQDKQILLCPGSSSEGNGEFVGVPEGSIGEIVGEIYFIEVKWESITLAQRYNKIRDLLQGGKFDNLDRDHLAYFFIHLRYSFTHQLTWQKGRNTQPKELSGAQFGLTDEICHKLVFAIANMRTGDSQKFLSPKDLYQQMLSMIGKGTGNGQAIRDEILTVMRKHGLKEMWHKHLGPKTSKSGHHQKNNDGGQPRNFYEEWHQKLHNNTTPEDIPICEAVIIFTQSGGDLSKYWAHLAANGIDDKKLRSYDRPITMEPWYRPDIMYNMDKSKQPREFQFNELVASWEHYLFTLKSVHSSTDLNMFIDEALQHVGQDTKSIINDLRQNYKDHDTLRQMNRALSLRVNIATNHISQNNIKKLKDIIYLDIGLEAYMRQLTEKIMHIDLSFSVYLQEISIILNHLCLSYQWVELQYCRDDWNELVLPLSKNLTEDNAKKIKCVVDRLKVALGEVNDAYTGLMQQKATDFGETIGAEAEAIDLFTEEIVRGTLFFSLSMILKKIDATVRTSANLGKWLVISQGKTSGCQGYVERVKVLADVMHKVYDRKTILLVEKITGEEEVPSNVEAIVVLNASDYPDVLAHVSVRARNLKVLLCVLFDDAKCHDLVSLQGQHVQLEIQGQNVNYKLESPSYEGHSFDSGVLKEAREGAASLKDPPMFKKSVMQISEFSTLHSGGKSNNLKILQGQIQQGIRLPESVVIPFKVLEYVLDLNPKAKKNIEGIIKRISTTTNSSKMNKMLDECKNLILGLGFVGTDAHMKFLQQSLGGFGVNDFQKAWYSIKRVWASKFNERAFLATKKLGVNLNQIFMAVLVQKIIPSEYAYVIHTTNPTNSNLDEVYVEACVGLGEALVGDMPGMAMAFSFNKQSAQCKLNSYPSKSVGLHSEGFIFRSDSNSEDLPGFAGAGLFDSYTMNKEKKFRVSYKNERLLMDQSYREAFMKSVGAIGQHIEDIYKGEPQDIEGAFYKGEYYVVQTRPQV